MAAAESQNSQTPPTHSPCPWGPRAHPRASHCRQSSRALAHGLPPMSPWLSRHLEISQNRLRGQSWGCWFTQSSVWMNLGRGAGGPWGAGFSTLRICRQWARHSLCALFPRAEKTSLTGAILPQALPCPSPSHKAPSPGCPGLWMPKGIKTLHLPNPLHVCRPVKTTHLCSCCFVSSPHSPMR